MTPKEKAKELFEKFMQPIDGLHKYPMCNDTAKQCALIAVDEILEITGGHINQFYQQVKIEISNL